jgi:hypothetical protein
MTQQPCHGPKSPPIQKTKPVEIFGTYHDGYHVELIPPRLLPSWNDSFEIPRPVEILETVWVKSGT